MEQYISIPLNADLHTHLHRMIAILSHGDVCFVQFMINIRPYLPHLHENRSEDFHRSHDAGCGGNG